ncbi:MAG TPA: DUF5654 family protein [Ktedonobacterales bacterium]|jgi:predicted PurR-regulated permease PerM
MDEHQTPAQQTVATVATAASTAATATAVAAAKKSRTPTPQSLIAQANSQLEVLKQAETIKQLQGQVKSLEKQSADTGKVFLATTTSLVTSAFALVAALAWNEAIQNLFKYFYPPPSSTSADVTLPLVISSTIYAVVVTFFAVAIIFYLTRLNTKLGAKSLIGEVHAGEGGGKKAESKGEGDSSEEGGRSRGRKGDD